MSNTISEQPHIWLISSDIMTPLGGGLRQQRWCEYLLDRGQSVRLFQLSGLWSVRWVDVHSVQQLRELRRAWVEDSPPKAGVRDTRFARIARFFKHALLLDLLYPSIYRAVRLMGAMLATAKEPVTVLCSSPPFAMGVIGRLLKARHGCRVIMALDMRDLWSLHTAFAGPKAHKRAVERWVIDGADIFTTVAPALADRFEGTFGRRPDVVFNVATHTRLLQRPDEKFCWSRLSADIREETSKIVYTGSIPANFYDLDAFLDAVEKFAGSTQSARVQFIFIGAGGELAARLRGRKLPPNLFVFIPQMTQSQVAAVQEAAEVLLFFGYKAADNQGQVSIKLFEYFRRAKPILPIHIRRGSDVDWLVDFYSGRPCPTLLTTADLEGALIDIAEGKASETLPTARDPAAADAKLLESYQRVADQIVARYRAGF